MKLGNAFINCVPLIHKLDVCFPYRKDNQNDYKIKIFDEKVKNGNEDYVEIKGYKLVKVNFYYFKVELFIWSHHFFS